MYPVKLFSSSALLLVAELVNSGGLWKAAALPIPIQVHTQEKDPHLLA